MELTIRKGDRFIIIKDFIYMHNEDDSRDILAQPFNVFTPTLIQIDKIRAIDNSYTEIIFHPIASDLIISEPKNRSLYDAYYDGQTQQACSEKDWIEKFISLRTIIYNDRTLKFIEKDVTKYCIPQSKICDLMFRQNEILEKLDRDYNHYFENQFSNEFNRLTKQREVINQLIKAVQDDFEEKKKKYFATVIKAVEEAAYDFEENKAYNKNLINYLVKD